MWLIRLELSSCLAAKGILPAEDGQADLARIETLICDDVYRQAMDDLLRSGESDHEE